MSDDVPPPPGPPPPPAVSSGPKPERGALLGSIQNFNKGGLKKAKTVDKSAPVTSRSGPSNDGSVSVSASVGRGAPSGGGPQPGFGNLFAGGVPRLRSASKSPSANASPPPPATITTKKQSSFLVEVGSSPAKPATTPTKSAAAPAPKPAPAPASSRPTSTYNNPTPSRGPSTLPKSSPPPVAQKQSSAHNVSAVPKAPVSTTPKPTTGASTFAPVSRPTTSNFNKPAVEKPVEKPVQSRPTSVLRPETPPSSADLDDLDNLIASFSPNSFIGAPVPAPNRQVRGDTAPSRMAPPPEISPLMPPPESEDSFSEPPSYAPPAMDNRSSVKPRDSVKPSYTPPVTSSYTPPPTSSYNPPPAVSTGGPTCDQCHRSITSGRYVQALGKSYHQEHFTCTSCSSNLGTDFYANENDSTPMCHNCYTSTFLTCGKCNRGISNQYMADGAGRRYHPECYALKCFKCSRSIEGQTVKALDRDYHLHCFTCTRCNRQLDEDFYEDFGNPLCLSCGKNPGPAPSSSYGGSSSNQQYSVPARSCASCYRSIDFNSNSNVVTIKDKMWHDTCFKCSSCSTSLNNGSTTIQVRQKPDGSIVCENCYARGTGITCNKCHRPITSRYMETEATGHKYHSECFSCHSCGCSLGSDYYVGDNGPLCGNCAVLRCDECRQELTGQYINALGRKVHQHCFRCANCKTGLRDDYYSVNNAPHCMACASRY